jgi:hypothetical protein
LFASQVESNCLPKGLTILKYKVSTSVLWVEVSFKGGGLEQAMNVIDIHRKHRYLENDNTSDIRKNRFVMD